MEQPTLTPWASGDALGTLVHALDEVLMGNLM